MPVTKYQTMNGRIRRRCTYDGGVVTDQVAVVTNALGSVITTYKDGWLNDEVELLAGTLGYNDQANL